MLLRWHSIRVAAVPPNWTRLCIESGDLIRKSIWRRRKEPRRGENAFDEPKQLLTGGGNWNLGCNSKNLNKIEVEGEISFRANVLCRNEFGAGIYDAFAVFISIPIVLEHFPACSRTCECWWRSPRSFACSTPFRESEKCRKVWKINADILDEARLACNYIWKNNFSSHARLIARASLFVIICRNYSRVV